MAKLMSGPPDWLECPQLSEIYSVSGCVSKFFTDYAKHWKHNGFWLFNSPIEIRQIADAENIDLTQAKLFYYEIYSLQFEEEDRSWSAVEPDPAFPTAVEIPPAKSLEGFDVVSASVGTVPECSPLCCNYLARRTPVNSRCLLASLDETRDLLVRGVFDHSEPGPLRIFAVYSLPAA